MKMYKVNRFWSMVITLLIVYGLVKWGVPAISRQITTLPFPLSVPGTLMFIYMTLTVVALFMLVTFSDEYMAEFLHPIKKLLRGEYSSLLRNLVLVAVPLIVSWQVYEVIVPKVQLPTTLRIQHPSSNFPKKFEDLKNPLSTPSDADIDAFIEQAKANEVTFIPQVTADIEIWAEYTEPEHTLEFLVTEPMKKFLAELESGNPSRETARDALLEKHLFEGRALYAMNCRLRAAPCMR